MVLNTTLSTRLTGFIGSEFLPEREHDMPPPYMALSGKARGCRSGEMHCLPDFRPCAPAQLRISIACTLTALAGSHELGRDFLQSVNFCSQPGVFARQPGGRV